MDTNKHEFFERNKKQKLRNTRKNAKTDFLKQKNFTFFVFFMVNIRVYQCLSVFISGSLFLVLFLSE